MHAYVFQQFKREWNSCTLKLLFGTSNLLHFGLKYLVIPLPLIPGAVAYSNAYFGRGTGPILLDDLLCTGSEARLVDCTHDGIGNYDFCSGLHYDDAGVRCQPGKHNK